MTRPTRSLIAVLMVLAVSTAAGQSRQATAETIFQEGLMLERAEGRVTEAIERYQRVIAEFSSERSVVARALLQLGDAYQKLSRPDARQQYERIVRDFADSPAIAAEARTRLTAGQPATRAAQSDGITSRRIMSGEKAGRYGSVSPDGRYLSFMDTTGDLAVRDLTTGIDRRITRNASGDEFAEYSVFSPDSTRLAYGWQNSAGRYELRSIGLAGGEPKQLYLNPQVGWLEPYDWSPDGRDILAIIARDDRVRQLVFVSASDGSVRVLKSLEWDMGVPTEARFSPDGRFVAYDRGGGTPQGSDVLVIAVDGSREVPLVTGNGDDTFLGWFPDGNSVLFSSNRTGPVGAWTIPVRNGEPAGDPRLVKPGIGLVQPEGFTRSGAFYYFQPGTTEEIYLAAIDTVSGRMTGAPVPLKGRQGRGRFATWSPDGDRLLYTGTGKSLTVHDVKTGITRSLPIDLTYVGPFPAWTPDGAVLLSGQDPKSRAGIFEMDLATGRLNALTMTDANGGGGARLTPDRKTLVYVHVVDDPAPQTWTLVARDIATAETRTLFAGVASFFALSPDGRSVAFRKAVKGGPPPALQVIPVGGGTPTEVLGQVRGPWAWMPDSRSLLVVRGADELWHVGVDGAQARKLDIHLKGMNMISVNPDGRRIAIVAAAGTDEIWVMENLGAAAGASR